MKKKTLLASGAVVLAAGTFALSATAFATDGINAPTAQDLAAGVLDGPAKAKKDKIELEVDQDTAVRAFKLTYTPGSSSGWHRHPGIVVAVVESGTVTRQLEDDCAVKTFAKGDVFTEVVGHLVANPSATEDAVLRITQFVPAGATPLRQDMPVDPCP
jgi:quercetin dioxygenase-like cupin family protein